MEDGGDASGSGALERPKPVYDLSARTGSTKTGPIFSQKETKAETTGKQHIDTAPQNLRGPEATHSQREHTGPRIDQGRGDRGRGSEPIYRARRVRERAAPPPLSVQRLEVPREPRREWRRVLRVRPPNTEVCICHSRCFSRNMSRRQVGHDPRLNTFQTGRNQTVFGVRARKATLRLWRDLSKRGLGRLP